MFAVTFALPQESQDFLRALERRRVQGDEVRGVLGGREILVLHTGVGPQRAAERLSRLLETCRPEWVISAGYAGGLDARLAAGDRLVALNFSDAVLVEKSRALLAADTFFGGLVSGSQVVESVEEKARLARASGALAVDMETGAVAGQCARFEVPLFSLRVISDAASQPMPVPMERWFCMEKQRPRPAALVAFLLANPGRIAPFARFVRGLGPARRALSRDLATLAARL